jgi:hypothetical protein
METARLMRRGAIGDLPEEPLPCQSIARERRRGRYPARPRGERRFSRERFSDESERGANFTILKSSSTPKESAGNLRNLGSAKCTVLGPRRSAARSSARFCRVAIPQGPSYADRMRVS